MKRVLPKTYSGDIILFMMTTKSDPVVFYLRIIAILLCGIISYSIADVFIQMIIDSIIYILYCIKIVLCMIMSAVCSVMIFQFSKDADIERKIKDYIFNGNYDEMTKFIVKYNDMVWKFCEIISNYIDKLYQYFTPINNN